LQGVFTQRYGIDYSFYFLTNFEIRFLAYNFAIAVQRNYIVVQIDINTVYLNTELNEDIYIEVPKRHPTYNHGDLKLNKALYGLKQAGREWNETLNNIVIQMNFWRLTSKPCIYVKENNSNEVQYIIALYVDDIFTRRLGKRNYICEGTKLKCILIYKIREMSISYLK